MKGYAALSACAGVSGGGRGDDHQPLDPLVGEAPGGPATLERSPARVRETPGGRLWVLSPSDVDSNIEEVLDLVVEAAGPGIQVSAPGRLLGDFLVGNWCVV